MDFSLSRGVNSILVLGAGASVDYGLPVWNDLGSLIKEKLSKDQIGFFQYKKEILAWVDKVGERKEYSTIDQCLERESVSNEYHANGSEIENQIFLIIKDIFLEKYKEGNGGWIRKLNEKILDNTSLVNKMAFINFNYDDVLERNLLNFEHLPQKHKLLNHRITLDRLTRIKIPALYPHGTLFSQEELASPYHVDRNFHTMKSGVGNFIDAVSCYESERHVVKADIYMSSLKLYLLGLGAGLRVNLGNISFDAPISEIHVTIKNPSMKEEVLGFLHEKYKLPTGQINVYGNCKELVEACF